MGLLEAEYQLFKSAVYSVAMPTAAANEHRRRLLDEFVGLQQRHAALVANLLQSHAHLRQVTNPSIHLARSLARSSVNRTTNARLH